MAQLDLGFQEEWQAVRLAGEISKGAEVAVDRARSIGGVEGHIASSLRYRAWTTNFTPRLGKHTVSLFLAVKRSEKNSQKPARKNQVKISCLYQDDPGD